MANSSVLEGNVRCRNGKKWKDHWSVIRRLSPVSDRLHVYFFRDCSDFFSRNLPRFMSVLEDYLGIYSGFSFDKEHNVMAIICSSHRLMLALPSREALIKWEITIRRHLGEEHQFPLRVCSAPSSSRARAGLRGRFFLRGRRLGLVSGLPPSLIASWNLGCIRKFGLQNGLFCMETGVSSEPESGLYAFALDRGDRLVDLLQEISHCDISSGLEASNNLCNLAYTPDSPAHTTPTNPIAQLGFTHLRKTPPARFCVSQNGLNEPAGDLYGALSGYNLCAAASLESPKKQSLMQNHRGNERHGNTLAKPRMTSRSMGNLTALCADLAVNPASSYTETSRPSSAKAHKPHPHLSRSMTEASIDSSSPVAPLPYVDLSTFDGSEEPYSVLLRGERNTQSIATERTRERRRSPGSYVRLKNALYQNVTPSVNGLENDSAQLLHDYLPASVATTSLPHYQLPSHNRPSGTEESSYLEMSSLLEDDSILHSVTLPRRASAADASNYLPMRRAKTGRSQSVSVNRPWAGARMLRRRSIEHALEEADHNSVNYLPMSPPNQPSLCPFDNLMGHQSFLASTVMESENTSQSELPAADDVIDSPKRSKRSLLSRIIRRSSSVHKKKDEELAVLPRRSSLSRTLNLLSFRSNSSDSATMASGSDCCERSKLLLSETSNLTDEQKQKAICAHVSHPHNASESSASRSDSRERQSGAKEADNLQPLQVQCSSPVTCSRSANSAVSPIYATPLSSSALSRQIGERLANTQRAASPALPANPPPPLPQRSRRAPNLTVDIPCKSRVVPNNHHNQAIAIQHGRTGSDVTQSSGESSMQSSGDSESTSNARTVLRPRSGREYQRVDRTKLEELNSSRGSSDRTPLSAGASVFTFDFADVARHNLSRVSYVRRTDSESTPPPSPLSLTSQTSASSSINYAEIDLPSIRTPPPARTGEVQYAVIDHVATAAASRVAREHARMREDSLKRVEQEGRSPDKRRGRFGRERKSKTDKKFFAFREN